MSRNPFAADPRLLEPLRARSQPASLGEGRIVFSQGDSPKGLHIVQTGEVTLVMTSERGRIQMTLHASAGSILGLPAVIADQPYSLTAIASEGSVVGFISRSDFEDMVHAEPPLCPYVLEVLAAEVRNAREAARDWEGRRW